MIYNLVEEAMLAWRNGSASVPGAGGCGFDPRREYFFLNFFLLPAGFKLMLAPKK